MVAFSWLGWVGLDDPDSLIQYLTVGADDDIWRTSVLLHVASHFSVGYSYYMAGLGFQECKGRGRKVS